MIITECRCQRIVMATSRQSCYSVMSCYDGEYNANNTGVLREARGGKRASRLLSVCVPEETVDDWGPGECRGVCKATAQAAEGGGGRSLGAASLHTTLPASCVLAAGSASSGLAARFSCVVCMCSTCTCLPPVVDGREC